MRCAKCLKQYPSNEFISRWGTMVCINCIEKERELSTQNMAQNMKWFKLILWFFGILFAWYLIAAGLEMWDYFN